MLTSLVDNVRQLKGRIAEPNREIEAVADASETARRLMTIPGIGLLAATALLATAGTGRQFRKGRDMVAWLGLVPFEHSTGGQTTLLGISKRGNPYVRTLLNSWLTLQLRFLDDPTTAIGHWALQPKSRVHANVVVVAPADIQARIAWVLQTRGSFYQVRPTD